MTNKIAKDYFLSGNSRVYVHAVAALTPLVPAPSHVWSFYSCFLVQHDVVKYLITVHSHTVS